MNIKKKIKTINHRISCLESDYGMVSNYTRRLIDAKLKSLRKELLELEKVPVNT